MKFFQTLESQFPDADLTIRIKAKDGIQSISVMPCSNNKNDIQPLIVSGSPEELDAQFFELIKQPLENTIAAIVNLEEQKSSVTASTEKQAPPAKKAAPAKVEAKKTTAKKDVPAPVEGSLFEDDGEPEAIQDKNTSSDQEGTQDDDDQNDDENND